MSTTQTTHAETRRRQTMAAHVITDLYNRYALPPLSWTISDAATDVLGNRLKGQVPASYGSEADRRVVVAQYASVLEAVPTRDKQFLDVRGEYAGVSVHVYTPVAEI